MLGMSQFHFNHLLKHLIDTSR
ncbi:hypothetical protein [Microcoleus sp. S13_B4]